MVFFPQPDKAIVPKAKSRESKTVDFFTIMSPCSSNLQDDQLKIGIKKL
jgi:hypothetical protein